MAYRSGFGTEKQRHEGGLNPQADQAKAAIQKARGGEGKGKAAETLTDAEGKASEAGREGGSAQVKPKP
jgi:hypothetical protein